MTHTGNINVNLIRLRRHFDINVKGYDYAALLDMSHVLRVWADMTVEVDSFLKDKTPARFHSYTLPEELKKFLWNKKYILTAFLPDGVLSANSRVFQMMFVEDATITKPFNLSYKKYPFASWMKTEAVRVSFEQHNKVTAHRLSVENIIRRVANAHGGSHPTGFEPRAETNDDIVLKHLFNWEIAGLPAPHLILLHIAKEILRIEGLFISKDS